MNDIMKLALDRRANLHEEVAKLDAFIRYGKSLLRDIESGAATMFEPRQMANSVPRADGVPSTSTDIPRPSVMQQSA